MTNEVPQIEFSRGAQANSGSTAAAMTTPLVCPKCGQAIHCIGERLASEARTFLSVDKPNEKYVRSTYRCDCGSVLAISQQRDDNRPRAST